MLLNALKVAKHPLSPGARVTGGDRSFVEDQAIMFIQST